MVQWILALMLLFSAYRAPHAEPESGAGTSTVSITLVITNIPKVEGVMRVALFNKEEGFRDENYAVRKEPFPVKSVRESFTFKDLPPGRYAAAVYHDANNNGKLDTNFLGIPTESYGFSNNVMGTFGPPSYQDASFEVLSGNKVISIKLR